MPNSIDIKTEIMEAGFINHMQTTIIVDEKML